MEISHFLGACVTAAGGCWCRGRQRAGAWLQAPVPELQSSGGIKVLPPTAMGCGCWQFKKALYKLLQLLREMIKFGSSFGPARRRFGTAFLPAPLLLLHNMGHLSLLKLLWVWILLCLWHQRNGALAPFEISVWNTKAAYLITLDLASARQFSPSAVAACSEIILSDELNWNGKGS